MPVCVARRPSLNCARGDDSRLRDCGGSGDEAIILATKTFIDTRSRKQRVDWSKPNVYCQHQKSVVKRAEMKSEGIYAPKIPNLFVCLDQISLAMDTYR